MTLSKKVLLTVFCGGNLGGGREHLAAEKTQLSRCLLAEL
jgi:hypothetical protein